ncbi:hypothetical protein RJ640_020271 [Escallonia rubra]|uniref:Uncharacterized protein n=1 Tax=Escallonia rubra TaxID=112253 RepID=A0AA88UT77_9ASTE|nr:hypothetical protein RJ640_020271 [Escallonia rubra]
MSFFKQQEPPNPSKTCKFLASTFKHAFATCHTPRRRLSSSIPEEEDDITSDYSDEQEEFVSEIRSKYMEAKSKRQTSLALDCFFWGFSPTTGELFIASKVMQQKEESDGEEREDYFSVGSCFSRCSSVEAFVSVRTNFSRCSSLNGLDFPDFPRCSIIQEFRHCEGWPFGLCRRSLLLPPLPKSPSDSWTWRKNPRTIKLH